MGRSQNTPPLRVFVAGLSHETNSFSPLPTSLQGFEDDLSYVPPSTDDRDAALEFAGYGDVIAVCRDRGDIVIEGPCYWTQPSGPIHYNLYAELRDAILKALEQAGGVDLVILSLHGAMMANTCVDCEGDVLTRVRSLVGPLIPVGALLDLHGNVSRQMVSSGAILVGCKEYPHTDYRDRAEELCTILSRMVRDGLAPVTLLRTIPSLSLQGTTEPAMHRLMRDIEAAEGHDGVLSITLMHGFPWSDSDQTGASVLVLSAGADPDRVDKLADHIADRFIEIVDAPSSRPLNVEEAVATGLRWAAETGPVIIADVSDNPGGGAAADSTFLLQELIDRGCKSAALGMLWDPQAARIASDAGVGARLRLRLGGKVGVLSGPPLDVEAEVLAVTSGARQRFFSETPNTPLGLAVALHIQGIHVIVNSLRQQVFAPECFTELGVSLHDKQIVVVKSSQHFRACFDPIAGSTIYCCAPGSMNPDLTQMDYRHLTVRRRKFAFDIDRSPTSFRWPTR